MSAQQLNNGIASTPYSRSFSFSHSMSSFDDLDPSAASNLMYEEYDAVAEHFALRRADGQFQKSLFDEGHDCSLNNSNSNSPNANSHHSNNHYQKPRPRSRWEIELEAGMIMNFANENILEVCSPPPTYSSDGVMLPFGYHHRESESCGNAQDLHAFGCLHCSGGQSDPALSSEAESDDAASFRDYGHGLSGCESEDG